MAETADVVVVGAGVMGCGTAYWLSRAGYQVLVVEKEAIACGASGMAAAMLEAAGHGARLDLDDPLAELARVGFALHRELASILPEESGVDIGYRENPVLHPAFTEDEVAALRPRALELHLAEPEITWLEGDDLWQLEPRLNRQALGAMVAPQAQVLAYRFVLALARAAERRGMVMRHGEVVGLERQGARVTGVRLRSGETIAAKYVVLAMGPWSGQVEAWTGLRVPVYPVRGQLLELRVPDPQLNASIVWQGMYLVHKADGITLAGTTEEHDSGFVAQPTAEGRQAILEAALHLAPSLEAAEIVGQVAGLRPCSQDRLPLIGAVPGWEELYLVSGHFRSGMLLSLISTRIIADLILTGQTALPIAPFDPGRFGSAEA
ncbi:MAG: glycine oxidase ThiO [Candidatus Tectimicrobiota bacterium]|nr:MAG: glycine oxidase ThiO [Candidatus Tectomicrobia bacterium]